MGLWLSENEGSKFWLNVLTELQNRGVKDILIACVDGLKGFPDAISTVFPNTQIQLCMRVKTGLEKVYGAFAASGQTETVIEMVPNKPSIEQCQAQGLSTDSIRLRLIRVDLKSGTEVLITNLLDEQTYPAKMFKGLYHLRWGIGVPGQGSVIQSVKVRPRPRDSSLVAGEVPWRESKTVKPSDKSTPWVYCNASGCNVQ